MFPEKTYKQLEV